VNLREIITPSTPRQLDEALPMLAGLTIPAILSAISTFMLGLSLMDIYAFVKKYNQDPNALTDEDWQNVFFDVAFAAVPLLGRAGRSIAGMMPAAVRKKAGDWMRGRIAERLRKDLEKNDLKYGAVPQGNAVGQLAKDRLAKKHAAGVTRANRRADRRLARLQNQTKIWSVIGWGVAVDVIRDYYYKMSDLETQYQQYVGGDRETQLFGDRPPSEAYALADQLRTKYVGELGVMVATSVASMTVARRVKAFGALVGGILGNGTLGQGLVKISSGLAAAIVAAGGPGIAVFLQTETGQKLMADAMVSLIVNPLAKMATVTWDAAIPVLQLVANQTDHPEVAAQLGSVTTNIKRTEPAAPSNSMRAVSSKTNPLAKYVDGSLVTDPATGYLLHNIPAFLTDIRDKARVRGLPDPLANIPRDPNKDYAGI